ncbi:MAG TPA: hypothetical protein VFV75_10435 [Candidatus Polarisedimenticolaceae bacterium]|nr:hypothetical protein [Candidatus Polarisedimenticolaceae bacterium]
MIALPDWGEWTTARDPYVRDFRIDGSPFSFDAAGQVVVPRALVADGQIVVTYQLRVRDAASEAHLERRLLPYRDGAHLFGFATNTLAELLVDGRPIQRPSIISIEAAPDDAIFTGWGGHAMGRQTAGASAELLTDNGVFAIGRVAGLTTRSANGVPVEVAQFAAGPDVTGEIADCVDSLVAAFARTTGRGPRGPVRVIVEPPREEGVFSGTHTNDGLVVELPVAPLSAPAKQTLAHELFHEWLGSQLVEDGSLTWFSEGFTDYISLWHATATGLLSPAEFAERMLDIDRTARTSTSLGRVRFAEPGTQWRDGNGPNETMAYRGGALLAFFTDIELRQRGSTVTDLLRQLLSRSQREYGLDDIRMAMTHLGVSDVYTQSIDGTHVPAVRPMLITAGFDEIPEPATLTYLGIEARYEGADPMGIVPAVVLAIDADGPAARVDLRVGDRIIDIGDLRGDPPIIGPNELTRYRFGLNVVPSGARTVTLQVAANGSVREVQVAPVRRSGGVRHSLRWNPERGARFLSVH